MTNPTILVVEDNESLAYGLKNNLEIEGYEVEIAADGRTGLDRAIALVPDLIVLDLMLPEMDGYQVLRRLRRGGLEMPVLILSARGEEMDKVQGFRLGADQYVTKPFGLLELLARVERLLQKAASGDGDEDPLRQFGEVEVDTAAQSVRRAGREVPLTPKEYDLLLTLLEHRGVAISRQKLLEQVWGYPDSVLTRTVDTHIAELRRKLERDPSCPEHIVTVRKVGYRLEPQSQ